MSLIGFPLLVIPFAIYNIIAFAFPRPGWSDEIAKVHMMSGGEWIFTPGDLLIAIAVIVLFVEMLKSTRLSTRTMVDHILSMVLFVVLLIEFLMIKQAATGTFFLLLIVSFVDVVAGFSITVVAARRNIQFEAEARA